MQVRYTARFIKGLSCCLYFVHYSSSGIQLHELSIMVVTYSILMLCIDHLITFECLKFTDLRDASLSQNHQPKRGIFKLKPPTPPRFFKTYTHCWVSIICFKCYCTYCSLSQVWKDDTLIWSWITWRNIFCMKWRIVLHHQGKQKETFFQSLLIQYTRRSIYFTPKV